MVDGRLRKGDTIRLMNTAKEYQVDEIGVRAPTPIPVSPCEVLNPFFLHAHPGALIQSGKPSRVRATCSTLQGAHMQVPMDNAVIYATSCITDVDVHTFLVAVTAHGVATWPG